MKKEPIKWEKSFENCVSDKGLEKEMATHSSILAWKIPWTEEPGGLHVIGLHKSEYSIQNTQRTLTTQ